MSLSMLSEMETWKLETLPSLIFSNRALKLWEQRLDLEFMKLVKDALQELYQKNISWEQSLRPITALEEPAPAPAPNAEEKFPQLSLSEENLDVSYPLEDGLDVSDFKVPTQTDMQNNKEPVTSALPMNPAAIETSAETPKPLSPQSPPENHAGSKRKLPDDFKPMEPSPAYCCAK